MLSPFWLVFCYTVLHCASLTAMTAQVKNKMAKPDFLKNNRGIDDGQDLAEDYMSELYDRIIQDEIKMKVRVQLEVQACISHLGLACGTGLQIYDKAVALQI